MPRATRTPPDRSPRDARRRFEHGRPPVPLVVLILLILPAQASLAHPFHETLAQIEHNRESHTLEIALRVDAVDLEQMVERWLGERIDLERDPRGERSLELWLRERLAARTDRGPAPLTWLGREFEGAYCWIYAEVEIPRGASRVDLVHLVLFDWHPFPTNHVVGVGASAGFSGATTIDAPMLRVPLGPREPALHAAARVLAAIARAALRAARARFDPQNETTLSG